MDFFHKIQEVFTSLGVINTYAIVFIVIMAGYIVKNKYSAAKIYKEYKNKENFDFREKVVDAIKNKSEAEQQLKENESKYRIILHKLNILENVDRFIKNAKFIKPVAIKENETIFEYIYDKDEGSLYKFEKFLLDNQKEVGIDEEKLAFRGLKYERVADPSDFIESHIQSIDDLKSGNPNVQDGGIGMNNEIEFLKNKVED